MKAQNLIITNILTGEKKIIHDIADFPEDLRKQILGYYTNQFFKDRIEYNITYGYSYDHS